jgi:hypothetical protein
LYQEVITDLNRQAFVCVQGMEYIHGSSIGSHGHLTAFNCVVDLHWSCKITDYGLIGIRKSLQALQRRYSTPDRNHLKLNSKNTQYKMNERPLILELDLKQQLFNLENLVVFT